MEKINFGESKKPDKFEYIDETDEEVFQSYVEDLDLSPEDFKGVILDVGSDKGQFARWAKNHHVSSSIHSLEPTDSLEKTSNGARGLAEDLPFRDEEFDLVVSNCAVPNVFINEDRSVLKTKILDSLTEFIRVIKKDGEIRLANVLQGDVYENQKIIKEVFNEVLEDLSSKYNLEVEKTDMKQDSYEYNKNGKSTRLLAKKFLIKIRKLGKL